MKWVRKAIGLILVALPFAVAFFLLPLEEREILVRWLSTAISYALCFSLTCVFIAVGLILIGGD